MNWEMLLNSDAGLTLVGGLLGCVWTFFKSTEWFEQRRLERMSNALQSLEVAVEETYRHYVASIKEAREDGRLTPGERQRARKMARSRAVDISRRKGVDLLRVLGEDHMDLWIAKMVRRLKG